MPDYKKYIKLNKKREMKKRDKKIGKEMGEFTEFVKGREPNASVIKVNALEQVRMHLESRNWVIFLGDLDEISLIEKMIYPPNTEENRNFILTFIEKPFINTIYMGKKSENLKNYLTQRYASANINFTKLNLIIFNGDTPEFFEDKSIQETLNRIYRFLEYTAWDKELLLEIYTCESSKEDKALRESKEYKNLKELSDNPNNNFKIIEAKFSREKFNSGIFRMSYRPNETGNKITTNPTFILRGDYKDYVFEGLIFNPNENNFDIDKKLIQLIKNKVLNK